MGENAELVPDLDFPHVRRDRRDAVTYLTLSRAPQFGGALLRALDAALVAAEGDAETKAIVLDVAEGPWGPLDDPAGDVNHAGGDDARDQLLVLLDRIDRGAKRVYAAVSAGAVGAGLEIVLACDGIYGAPPSSLAFPPESPPTPGSRAFERARALSDDETAEALIRGVKFEAIQAYTSGLYDGILVGDLQKDISVFARREAALPRGRYHAAVSHNAL